MERRPGEPYYGLHEFESQCEEAGGEYIHDPADEGVDIAVCDFGDHELAVHDYAPDTDENAVVLHNHGGTDWKTSKGSLRFDNNEFVMEDASGNPGPGGGMPMRVEDAIVRVGRYGVDAERRQRL